MATKTIEKSKLIKKRFPLRKNQDCTSFYFVLCGEKLKIIQHRKDQHKIDTGKELSWEAATNLVILGK